MMGYPPMMGMGMGMPGMPGMMGMPPMPYPGMPGMPPMYNPMMMRPPMPG